MYELGKKKLLRKAENRQFPTFIVRIHSQGDRIYVADAMESMHFVKYKRHENSFVIFADDTTPRFVTASTLLDYDRSEEHTSELQSLMRISYAVFCLKKKIK